MLRVKDELGDGKALHNEDIFKRGQASR